MFFRITIPLIFTIAFNFSAFAQKTIEIKIDKDEVTRVYTLYCINNSYATHSVELKFSKLENLKPSIDGELYWEVGNGKTKLLTLTPIDIKQSTDFKYKKKSRKGCSQLSGKKDLTYQLPIDLDAITKADLYTSVTADKRFDGYAISLDVSPETKVQVAKEGIVTEITEIRAATQEGEKGGLIGMEIEIEHYDCSFAKYELQPESEILVKAGDKVVLQETIATIKSSINKRYYDLIFSVYYIAYDELITNGSTTRKLYFKCFLPVDFNSKKFSSMLKEVKNDNPIKMQSVPLPYNEIIKNSSKKKN